MKNSRIQWAALLAFAALSTASAQVVWDGDDDGNWNTGANWVGGTAPVGGDSLQFDGTNTANNNDIAADTNFTGIDFAAGAAAFALDGNRITLGGDVSNNSLNAQTIDLDMILSAPRVFNAVTGDITVNGVLSGTGGFTQGNNPGTVTLTGANTFTGPVWIQRSTLNVSSINSVVGGSATSNLGAPTTVADGTITFGTGFREGTLNYTGTGETTDRVVSMAGVGGARINQSGTGVLEFTSDVTQANEDFAHTVTLAGSTAGTGVFSGVIDQGTDNGGTGITNLVKTGSGTWTLQGDNTYLGGTTVSGGTLVSDRTGGALADSGDVTIDGGILEVAQDDTVNDVTLTSGSITGAGTITPNSISVDNASGTTTISSGIGGSGTLTKSNAGQLDVLADNSGYSGAVDLQGGTIYVDADNALGTGTIDMADGTMIDSGNTSRTLGNDINLNGDVQFGTGVTRKLTFTGDINLGASDRTITYGTGGNGNFALQFQNTFSGTGNLILDGEDGSDYVLFGNAANAFTGDVTLVDGIIQLNQNDPFGSGTLRLQGGTLSPDGNQSRTVSNDVSIEGDVDLQTNGTSELFLNGDMDLNGSAHTITLSGGVGNVREINGVISNGALTLAEGAVGQLLSLGGVNTYTGDTTVGGTIELTLEDDAAFTFAIGADGVNNQLAGTGTVNLDGDFIFDLFGASTLIGDSWTIVNSSLTEVYGATFTVQGFTESLGIWSGFANGREYQYDESTNILSVAGIPEPGTAGLLLLAVGLLGFRRRR